MATIENLNFKVILDDKDFNKNLKELENLARKFNTTMSNLLNLREKGAKISQKEVENQRKLLQLKAEELKAQEKINRELKKTEGMQSKINTQVYKVASSSHKMSVSWQQASSSLLQMAAFTGFAALIKDIVRITGEFELQKTTLAAMLDDLGAAEHLIGKIKDLAVESPFTFKELTGYTKQLTAFGVPEDELFDTTKMIADLSAGLGVAADRLILAYGQVKSAAFLRGQEVRQFTEAGIPILQALAEEFEKLEGNAVSVGEVFDRISARQVSFEMVAKVLRDMTSEGGKFYNMQQIQADTLWGKIQKLKDQWQIALDQMGKANNNVINKSIDRVTNFIKNWERVGRVLRMLIFTFGAYKATLLLVWAAEKAVAGVQLYKAFMAGTKSIAGFTAALKVANISLAGFLGFAGGLIGLVIGLATSFGKSKESARDLNEELENIYERSKVVGDAFSRHVDRLNALTRGTEAYRESLQDLNATYSEYLPKVLSEADSYEAVAEAVEKAKLAITEKARQDIIQKMRDERDRQLEGSKKSYDDFLSSATAEQIAFFNKLKASLPLNITSDEYSIMHYVAQMADSFFGDARDWNSWIGSVNNAIRYLVKVEETDKDIYKRAAALFTDATYSSIEEYDRMLSIIKERDKKLVELKNKTLDKSTYRDEELKIEKEYLQDLIALYTELGNVTLADKYKKELQELEDFWASWRGKVQDLLMDRGHSESHAYGLWPTEYTSSTDYIDALLKDYKDVTDKLDKLHFDPKTEGNLEDQKKLIEAIADLLNIDLTSGKRKGSDGKTELERKINALSALKKAYDSLKELNLSDVTIIEMLKENFPDIVDTYGESFIEALNFTERILKFGKELKATDKDRANSILQSLGLDGLSNDKKVIKDAIDAATKYFEAIRKWQSADFSIEGEGIAFDIGKIANTLSTKFNEIDLEAKKLAETLGQINLEDTLALEAIKNTFDEKFGVGSWDVFFEEFVSKGEAAILDFSEKEKNYERKLAQEKLNDMAKKMVNESLESMDMTHWGDKTISQIEAIRQEIINLMGEDINLPDSTIEKLSLLGLTTEDLILKIQELLGEKLDNVTTEKIKALAKAIKDAASFVKDLGEDIESLGEAFDNNGVKKVGQMLKAFEELASILTECDGLMQIMFTPLEKATEDAAEGAEEVADSTKDIMKSADIITLVAKIAITLFGKIVDGIVESQQALHDARMAAIEFGNALEQISYNESMESYKTLLGTDEYRQAAESMRSAADYMQSALKAAEQIKSKLSFGEMFLMKADEVAFLNKWLEAGDILVDMRSSWQKFWGTGNDLVQKFNISEFIDEEGNLMGEKLREFMNAYGDDISDANKEALTKMLNEYDLYVQAIEEATAYMEEIFGNVAEDMADAFIQAFKASGEAALDYADIMDEVATSVAKSVVKSMILENVVDEEKMSEMAKMLLSDPSGAMAMLDEVMRAAQDLAPHIQAFLEQMQPYFKMEDEAQTLGDGIKGITEDTANLLASYLNAIRADVSYSKTLWERMDATTQQIAAALLGLSAPTLMEYQAQIAANTYNTAMNTQMIMQDLKSVLTSEGGMTAIRTYS